ncbi:MAG: protease inhibitor I42 family protein [Candidatus Margulisiibacteriota bacterium]
MQNWICLAVFLSFFGFFNLVEAKVLEAKLHTTFELKLDSNPTTGYLWQLKDPINRKYIKELKNIYIGPNEEKPGAGGMQVWTFKTMRKGKTSFTLQYTRPWENGAKPVREETFELTIK